MFYVCKAALPVMHPGGTIINTASIEGDQLDTNLLGYATTKVTIVNFTKALAQEAMQSGITGGSVGTALDEQTAKCALLFRLKDNALEREVFILLLLFRLLFPVSRHDISVFEAVAIARSAMLLQVSLTKHFHNYFLKIDNHFGLC
jgi:NAD(P)-dependent dehydrogenase (short-subunit alcohol dehydrogenase family)